MGAIDSAIKSEIVRLAKREARKLDAPLREEIKRLKKKNLELRSKIASIEGQAQKLHAKDRLAETTSKVASGGVTGRLSPRLVKSLRTKLGLAQNGFARLLGVSIGSIVNWETGKIKPRSEMRAKILSFRGMGRREVKMILSTLIKPSASSPEKRTEKMPKEDKKSINRRSRRKVHKKATRRMTTRK